MSTSGPLNERTCPECGQTTLTKQWQEVNFCAGCGVEFGSTDDDRQSHVAVGLVLSCEEVDRLADGREVSRSRSVSNDRRVTVNLLKEPR